MNIEQKDIERFWTKVDKKSDNECWEWKSTILNTGYGQFTIKAINKYSSHRIAYSLYNNEVINITDLILHNCDNRKCCNPYHLRKGTHKENMKDMTNRNRSYKPNGEKHPNCKLTEQDIIDIRAKYIPRKYTQQKLADEYNLSIQHVSDIINKKKWKHI